MLNGITRFTTPASLVRLQSEQLVELVSRRVRRRMHGYLPIPYSSHRDLFDTVASRKQSEFVIKLGTPVGFLKDDHSYELRIDLLSAEAASDPMLRGLSKTLSKLFEDKLGIDILVSSAMVCGVGIHCHDPSTITGTQLTVRDLWMSILPRPGSSFRSHVGQPSKDRRVILN